MYSSRNFVNIYACPSPLLKMHTNTINPSLWRKLELILFSNSSIFHIMMDVLFGIYNHIVFYHSHPLPPFLISLKTFALVYFIFFIFSSTWDCMALSRLCFCLHVIIPPLIIGLWIYPNSFWDYWSLSWLTLGSPSSWHCFSAPHYRLFLSIYPKIICALVHVVIPWTVTIVLFYLVY